MKAGVLPTVVKEHHQKRMFEDHRLNMLHVVASWLVVLSILAVYLRNLWVDDAVRDWVLLVLNCGCWGGIAWEMVGGLFSRHADFAARLLGAVANAEWLLRSRDDDLDDDEEISDTESTASSSTCSDSSWIKP
mmetsp:Transcript_50394/g.94120  ORF Transcript_50394/g.94120 Transcript_50394/m.94120 type:complete len:133 (+) Transcript_50394:1-399(+)